VSGNLNVTGSFSCGSETDTGTLSVGGNLTVTGNNFFISQPSYFSNISEKIQSIAGSTNISVTYTSGSVINLSSNPGGNFTVTITGIPNSTASTGDSGNSYVFTVINSNSANTTYYCNSVVVNGSAAVTPVFNGGSSAISLTTASIMVQQCAITWNGSAYKVLSNVSGFSA